MRSFNTKEYPKYSFEVDGKPYFLPGLNLGMFDDVVAIKSKDSREELAAAAINFIKALAPDQRTLKAIQTLSIHDVGSLFTDWTGGVSPGESSSSTD